MRADDRGLGVLGRLHALGKLEVPDPDGATDLQLGDVNGDRVRDRVGLRLHVDREELLIDLPVVVAHFDGVADDQQRHLDLHALGPVHDLEVDVVHGAADRVALDLASEHEVVLGAGHEVEQRVQTLLA